MRRVNLELVQDTKRALASELRQKDAAISLRQVVQELLPEIKSAMQRGYTLEEIAKLISKRIPITVTTLRGYMYGKDRVENNKKKKLKK